MFKTLKEVYTNWKVSKLLGIVPIKLCYKIRASYKDENGVTYKKLVFKDMGVSDLDIIVRPKIHYNGSRDKENRVDIPIAFHSMSTQEVEDFLVAILLEYANLTRPTKVEHPIFIKKVLKHMKKQHDLDPATVLFTARSYGGALDVIREFLNKPLLELDMLGICLFYNDYTTVFIDNEKQKEHPITLRELTKKRGKYLILKLKSNDGGCAMFTTISHRLELKDIEILNQ